MYPDEPGTRFRFLIPFAAGLALLVLALFALQSVSAREEQTKRAMIGELDERLADRVLDFELRLRDELDQMMAAASDPDADLSALQAVWRRTHPWFDALYAWETRETEGMREVFFRFPRAEPPQNTDLGRCVRLAYARALGDGSNDDVRLAEAYLAACGNDADRAVRAYASTEAANRLREAGRPHEALAALEVAGLDDRAPIRATPDVGTARRITRRLLAADLLDDVGSQERASRLRQITAAEILELDAPDLEATIFQVPGLIDRLESAGREVRNLHQREQLAEQRLAAYREIRETALRRSSTQVSEAARFTFDQYSELPYLLYTIRRDQGREGVALQLRQDQLLQEFLSAGTGFTDQIVVSDLSGRTVAGAVNADPSEISAPFRETLTHLRATLTSQAVQSRIAPGGRATTLAISAVTTFCVVLGLVFIYLQAKANQRHRLLLQRQRDFTARVTHELKTPLAGIKVMAENLSIGAYRDAAQREDMANRIMAEADRLTDRVNELLDASRKREIPDPEPLDLEEVLLELIDTWGPRYEQREVALVADMEPVDPVLGDPVALRDAIACLLDNALKYRREDIDSKVWLNVREDPGWAEIEVLDNGLGVPAEQREAIFERFVRVEGDNRGKSGGHGLGLAQVKEIVTAHRGTVRCEPGIDGGARFVVRLPLAP